MAVGAILFAMMNFLARLATDSASWATVAAIRAFVGALVAYGSARARGVTVATNDPRGVFWRSLLGTVAMLSTFYALSSRAMSLGDTVTLLNLAPVFLAVLAPIVLRERTSAAVAIAIAIALTGVALIVRPAFLFHHAEATLAAGATGPSAALTAAVAVLGALSTAIAMMFLRRIGPSETPEAIAFHFSIFAGMTFTVLSLFDLHAPTARDAACMIAAGLCAGVAQIAMTRAYTLERAARVSGMSYLSVVASALLGAAALGERPGWAGIAGMALVVAGGLVVTFARSA